MNKANVEDLLTWRKHWRIGRKAPNFEQHRLSRQKLVNLAWEIGLSLLNELLTGDENKTTKLRRNKHLIALRLILALRRNFPKILPRTNRRQTAKTCTWNSLAISSPEFLWLFVSGWSPLTKSWRNSGLEIDNLAELKYMEAVTDYGSCPQIWYRWPRGDHWRSSWYTEWQVRSADRKWMLLFFNSRWLRNLK